ncbi:hypothetical protein B296_00002297 [Ensete ventricosum]|uniref:Uncharacterized protein n=1 Tax=Ensete ventricosum TaxID=4639 RepID=A0A427A9Y9_ENSVE|nr:hypothetical protein B296_00002297 [Ensete ventricosum]
MRTRMWCPAHLGVGSYAHRDMTTIDGREPTKLETGRCQLGSLLCSLLAAQTSPGTLFFWHLNSSGVDRGHFFLGFVATLGAAGLFAVYLPVMQLVYRGVKSYRTVVEVQRLVEEGGRLGPRRRPLLGGGGGHRSELAALLHGHRGDGVPDVLGTQRHLHDGAAAGQCGRRRAGVRRLQGGGHAALPLWLRFLSVRNAHQQGGDDNGNEGKEGAGKDRGYWWE